MIRKDRLHRKNASGSYDTVHLEANINNLSNDNGERVNNLLLYKVAGTDVSIPDVPNIDDLGVQLTSRVDNKLTEIDTTVDTRLTEIDTTVDNKLTEVNEVLTTIDSKLATAGSIVGKYTIKSGETINALDVINVSETECFKDIQTTAPVEGGSRADAIGMVSKDILLRQIASKGKVTVYATKIDGNQNLTDLTSIDLSSNATSYTPRYFKSLRISDNRFYFIFADGRSSSTSYIYDIRYNDGTLSATLLHSGSFAMSNSKSSLIKVDDDTVIVKADSWRSIKISDGTVTAISVPTELGNCNECWSIGDSKFVGNYLSSSNYYAFLLFKYTSTTTTSSITYLGISSTFTKYTTVKDVIPIGNNLFMAAMRQGNMNIPSVAIYSAATNTPTQVSSLILCSDTYSGSYGHVSPAIAKFNNSIAVAYKDLSAKNIVISNLTVSSDGSSITESNKSALFYATYDDTPTVEIYSFDNAAVVRSYTTSVNTSIYVQLYNGSYVGEVINRSVHAIALQSGVGGDQIDVAFAGVVHVPVTAGTKITSAGVCAYAPLMNRLDVTPLYKRYPTYVTGTYTGTLTDGNIINLGFKPSAVFVINRSPSTQSTNFYPTQVLGFAIDGYDYMRGSSVMISIYESGDISGFIVNGTSNVGTLNNTATYLYIAFR